MNAEQPLEQSPEKSLVWKCALLTCNNTYRVLESGQSQRLFGHTNECQRCGSQIVVEPDPQALRRSIELGL